MALACYLSGQGTGGDTDLWVIMLWKDVCIFLIANEHNVLFLAEIKYCMLRYICLFIISVNLFWWWRDIPLIFSLGILLWCVYKNVHTNVCGFFHLFIYFLTEPTVGPRCVARKQCPMATAEAHASTRTFLWKKQDKPVQRKSEFMSACFFSCSPCIIMSPLTA